MNRIGSRKCSGYLQLLKITLLSLLLLAPLAASAEPPRSTTPDLAKHPIYSTYQFNKDGRHIYFGTQPLAIEGVITEVMRRDSTLKKNLKAMGVEIVFYPFLKGPDILFFSRRGDIDMATVGTAPTLIIAATADAQITGMTKVSSASLITKKGVADIKALKGKRIGYPEGTTAHLGVLTALSMGGMKDSDVRMIPMEVGELAVALAENRIEAFSAFEPTPTGALAKHKDFVSIHRFFIPGYIYQTRLFAEKQSAASLQLHASFARSLRWLKKSDKNLSTSAAWTLQAIESLTGKKSEVAADQLKSVAKSDLLRFADSPVVSEVEFKQEGFLNKSFSLLKAQGKLPSDASWEKVVQSVNSQILKGILANPSKYQLNTYTPE